MSSRPVLVLVVALGGCATTAVPPSRYVIGDFVVYRYDSDRGPPITLREEITTREGANRLTIEVTATRGSQTRRWIQVVTDTPANRRKEQVDEVYEIVGGRRVRLENEKNADLYRLYEWTVPPVLGSEPPVDVARDKRKLDFAGGSFDCTVERGRFPTSKLTYELAQCPEFLWTNGPGRVTSDGGKVVWSREVAEVGRR